MNTNSGARAVGVRMINGDGEFLPEYKRSLPTPLTLFFKITGINHLYPKSALFNKYDLPQIDKNSTTEAEDISGAFMFMRRDALYKAGLPDEDFYMYGEDVDFSYRILKQASKIFTLEKHRLLISWEKALPKTVILICIISTRL